MKKISFHHWKPFSKKVLLSLVSFALAQSAHSSITVHFVEEGDDVRVTFSGSIDLTGAPLVTTTTPGGGAGATIGSSQVTSGGPVMFLEAGAGFAATTGLATTAGATVTDTVFGFVFGNLFFGTRHITGGTTGNVTELTADSSLDTFVITDATLADIGADSLVEGQALWTSNGTANDTFNASFLSVPEPSVGILAGLSALGLFRRRR